jgi:hypothetical protein
MARYDTMIEKKTHMETPPTTSISAYSNGLRRVDSEGTASLSTTNSSQSARAHGKGGFSFRTVSADHLGLPRQGGTNFSELFEKTKNMQETFV